MPSDSAKAAALRDRARKKLEQESRTMTSAEKARLPQIRKRLARKVRSSLPDPVLTPSAA